MALFSRAMNDWLGTIFWYLVLFGGLIAVPFAYTQRSQNLRRFRAVVIAAVLYLATQAAIYVWIYGILRFENRDWLIALFLPITLGIVFAVIMALVWGFTDNDRAT